MKNIVIAAGYATRLYPLTENFPKPLLEVGDTTILGRLIEDVDALPEIDEHIIVTNSRFSDFFSQWASVQTTRCPVTVIDDGTFTNETRLGAVRDLLLAIESRAIDEDILVMAADNILDFSFKGFLESFKEKRTSLIMCHKEPSIEKLRRTGVVELDAEMKVISMQEKPAEPVSHWAVPPFYIYSASDLPLIRTALEDGCGYDAPGNLARYLCGRTTMHAWEMPGRRYDVGTLDSYEEVKSIFG